MSVSVSEIKGAVQRYLTNDVSLSVDTHAEVGQTINAGENFRIELKVSNNGTQKLNNVRYIVRADESYVLLIVPSNPPFITSNYKYFSQVQGGPNILQPGKHVGKMVIFPQDERQFLYPGETEFIKIMAWAKAKITETEIKFKIQADVDFSADPKDPASKGFEIQAPAD